MNILLKQESNLNEFKEKFKDVTGSFMDEFKEVADFDYYTNHVEWKAGNNLLSYSGEDFKYTLYQI